MNNNNYNGGLTREQFLYYEIKTVARLICEKKNRNEIIQEVFENNLFQFPTERMIKSIAKTCFKRIDALDSETLVYYLANSSAEVAKQINLYAIMCENSIVYDFMTEVIGEKFRTRQFDFSGKDINVFFMELGEKVPAIDDWSESTVKKIKQVLTKFLVECGYLETGKSQVLMPVYLYPELEDNIRTKNDTEALAAFNCFN